MRAWGATLCLLLIAAVPAATQTTRQQDVESLRQAAVSARAKAELARASVLRQLEADPSYQKATAEVRAKQKRLDELRDSGTPQEKGDAAAALAAARNRVTTMRNEAMGADPDVRAAVAEALQADVAFAQAQRPPPEPQPLRLEKIIASLPRDAQPDARHGWDQFVAPKAHQSLSQQYAGQEAIIEATIRKVEVRRVANPKHPDETDDWVISIYTNGTRLEGRAVPASLAVATVSADDKGKESWGSGHVDVATTEALAAQARDWKENDRVWVAGKIRDIAVTGDGEVKEPHAGIFTVLLFEPKVVKRTPYKAPPAAAPERHPTIQRRR